MHTPPYNPFFALVRARFELWQDASDRLGVDRKTLQRWLEAPGRVRIEDLMLLSAVFDIGEAQLLAAAIASSATQTAVEASRAHIDIDATIQVVDLFDQRPRKASSSSN